MTTSALAFLTQPVAAPFPVDSVPAVRDWVKQIIGNRNIPLPTTAQDWTLLRSWHHLVHSITLLAQWENEQLAQSRQRYAPTTLALKEDEDQLQPLLASPALSELAQAFSTLPMDFTPPTSIRSLLAVDVVPSFLAAYQALEDDLLQSRLQVDQLSNLKSDSEIGLNTQIELERTMPVFPEENLVAIERANKSSILLARKTEEYKTRLATLEKRGKKYQSKILPAERFTIPEIESLAQEYSTLKLRRNELRNRLLVFGDLPSDTVQAKAALSEKRKAVAALRRDRDQMLNDMGAAVF